MPNDKTIMLSALIANVKMFFQKVIVPYVIKYEIHILTLY